MRYPLRVGKPRRPGVLRRSLGSTELCVPAAVGKATHSFHSPILVSLSLHFANLGLAFTSPCQPWLHSHFTLPAWLHFLFHFTSFLLHPSRLRWQIATQSGGPRASGLIAVSQRQAGKETFLQKAKARAKETFLTRKAKAKASSRESDPSDVVDRHVASLAAHSAHGGRRSAQGVFLGTRSHDGFDAQGVWVTVYSEATTRPFCSI